MIFRPDKGDRLKAPEEGDRDVHIYFSIESGYPLFENPSRIHYDLMGRRTAIVNPDTGRTAYSYDAGGNLTSKLSANYQVGKEIKYNYSFNRLTGITYPDSAAVLYEYGPMNGAYNRAGRIAKVTDESALKSASTIKGDRDAVIYFSIDNVR